MKHPLSILKVIGIVILAGLFTYMIKHINSLQPKPTPGPCCPCSTCPSKGAIDHKWDEDNDWVAHERGEENSVDN